MLSIYISSTDANFWKYHFNSQCLLENLKRESLNEIQSEYFKLVTFSRLNFI